MGAITSITDLGVMSTPLYEVKNTELKEHVTAIYSLTNEAKKALFAIAVHMLVIKDKELWREDGFESVFDFANKVLGYTQTTVSTMLTIAREYVLPGETIGEYKSILAHDNGDDYSLNQLRELKPLGKDVIIDLDGNGEISPGMSVKAIREVVQTKRGNRKKKKEGSHKKRNKAEEVREEAQPLDDDVGVYILRVIESIPYIMANDAYKDNHQLRKAFDTITSILEVPDEDEL